MKKKKFFSSNLDIQFVHEKTGVSVSSIYRHVNGESVPRLDVAMKYHEFGVSFDEMLEASKSRDGQDQLPPTA